MFQRAVPFLFGLLTGLLSSGLLYLLTAEPRGQPIELHPPPTPEPLRVYVSGAVRQPGVVSLAPGSIVEEALAAAGGPLAIADLSGLNLAAAVQAGQRLHVPQQGQATPSPVVSVASPATLLVNVNTASAPELERLPGIGPVLASNIIAHRQAHGPFRSPEDLLRVPGIGPAKLSQIRDLIVFE